MSINTSYQYVKFVRGTSSSWETLATKDNNTLYFISENNSNKGKLYLGEKLISDANIAETLTIEQITEKLIEAGVANNSLLVYNTEENKWETQPTEKIISKVVSGMIGATITEDGKSGLVPSPSSNQYHMFLRGDGTWQDPADSVTADLTDIQKQLNTLIGDDEGKSVADIIGEHEATSTWGSF